MILDEILALEIMTAPPPDADVRVPYGDNAEQFGDLRLPAGPGPHPVAIVIHGGAWTSRFGLEHIGHLAAALTAKGLATWTIEFRRVGSPGGGWPTTFHDVARGLDHLRELARAHPLDLDRVVALGHSSGGHLALWAAARHCLPPDDPLFSASPIRLDAVVSIAGIPSLAMEWELSDKGRTKMEDLMGGSPERYPERYRSASPSDLVPLGVRQVLIHGTDDTSVPPEFSRSHVALARSRGDDATLIALDGAGHFELIDPRSREWPAVEQAILDVIGAL